MKHLKAFTLIEILTVLSILSLVTILAYNLFGATARDAKLEQQAVELRQQMLNIGRAYEEYIIRVGEPGTVYSTVEVSSFKDALVSSGVMKSFPRPNPEWLKADEGCITQYRPDGSYGWGITNNTNYGGSVEVDVAVYMYCIKHDLCEKFNSLFTDQGSDISAHFSTAEAHGGMLCAQHSAGYSGTILGIIDLN